MNFIVRKISKVINAFNLFTPVAVCCLLSIHHVASAQTLTMPMIAAGFQHAVTLKDDGTVVTWGDNTFGQLGLGRSTFKSQPFQVNTIDNIQAISAGSGFNIALKRDGTVWAWGNNNLKQLGDGSIINSSSPIIVKKLPGVSAVSANSYTASVLANDGSVWSWGQTPNQCGGASLPSKNPSLNNVKALVTGINYCLALQADGTVLAQGTNSFGEVGDGTTTLRTSPVPVMGISNVKAIVAGRFEPYSAALKADGTVWTWGIASDGGAGSAVLAPKQVPGLDHVVSLYAGAILIFAVKDDGSLWSWTPNSAKSTPSKVANIDNVAEISSAGNTVLALKKDGTTWAWKPSSNIEMARTLTTSLLPVKVAIPNNPVAISAGSDSRTEFAAFIYPDGTMWAWGDNGYGELGDGANNTEATSQSLSQLSGITAVAASGMLSGGASFAVTKEGNVWAWGDNNNSALANNSINSRPSPGLISGLTNVSAVYAGELAYFAVKPDGTVWSWGTNTDSIVFSNVPKKQAGLANIRTMAVGEAHFLALDKDGYVWSWGFNDQGQVGDGTTTTRNDPQKLPALNNIVSIAAGLRSSYALTAAGQVFAWSQAYSPTQSLVPTLVNHLEGVTAIAASGWTGAFALKADGTVWKVGEMDTAAALSYGWNAPLVSPVKIDTLSGVVAISAGYGFLLAQHADGTISTIGLNNAGQQGNGTYANQYSTGYVVDTTATAPLQIAAAPLNNIDSSQLNGFFVKNASIGTNLSYSLTDPRATGFDGDIYFTALLPANSPLLPNAGNGFADTSGATIPVTLGRGGVKQTGPGVPGAPAASGTGTITAGNSFAVWTGVGSDPLAGNNAVVCMGVTIPALSAKGQVLMRPIANGTNPVGVTQCPTVQTAATIELYKGNASGTLSNLTLNATISPQPEDRGQVRNVYSWAIAPNGQQYMQTSTGWALMSEPMQAAATVTVPASGDVLLPVLNGGIDLTSLKGTLVYVGMGSSWAEVKQLNKAGHYYTLQ